MKTKTFLTVGILCFSPAFLSTHTAEAFGNINNLPPEVRAQFIENAKKRGHHKPGMPQYKAPDYSHIKPPKRVALPSRNKYYGRGFGKIHGNPRPF